MLVYYSRTFHCKRDKTSIFLIQVSDLQKTGLRNFTLLHREKFHS